MRAVILLVAFILASPEVVNALKGDMRIIVMVTFLVSFFILDIVELLNKRK